MVRDKNLLTINILAILAINISKFFTHEQERQTKVIVSIEQNEKTTTMEQFYKILNLVFKFDLRDNPNSGTYSLLEVGYYEVNTRRRKSFDRG